MFLNGQLPANFNVTDLSIGPEAQMKIPLDRNGQPDLHAAQARIGLANELHALAFDARCAPAAMRQTVRGVLEREKRFICVPVILSFVSFSSRNFFIFFVRGFGAQSVLGVWTRVWYMLAISNMPILFYPPLLIPILPPPPLPHLCHQLLTAYENATAASFEEKRDWYAQVTAYAIATILRDHEHDYDLREAQEGFSAQLVDILLNLLEFLARTHADNADVAKDFYDCLTALLLFFDFSICGPNLRNRDEVTVIPLPARATLFSRFVNSEPITSLFAKCMARASANSQHDAFVKMLPLQCLLMEARIRDRADWEAQFESGKMSFSLSCALLSPHTNPQQATRMCAIWRSAPI